MTRVLARLVRAAVAHATDADAYRDRVARECGAFPEGPLFPYVFPALALCAWPGDRRVSREAAHGAALTHATLAHSGAVSRIGPIAQLPHDAPRAVDMGWLALLFGVLRESTGVTRYDDERAALCAALRRQLDDAPDGGVLFSYPGACWPFDTLPAVVALALEDRLTGTPRAAGTISRHLAWLRGPGLDAASGLPVSALAGDRCTPTHRPRGCDLSLRIALLTALDPALARSLYATYARAYWSDRFVLAGFREWLPGETATEDLDSGPVIAGVGMAASAFGLAATRLVGDRWRYGRLRGQLGLWDLVWRLAGRLAGDRLRGAAAPGLGVPLDPACVTGFLFGDACLMLALGWPTNVRR